jgi:hypothetical protein
MYGTPEHVIEYGRQDSIAVRLLGFNFHRNIGYPDRLSVVLPKSLQANSRNIPRFYHDLSFQILYNSSSLSHPKVPYCRIHILTAP